MKISAPHFCFAPIQPVFPTFAFFIFAALTEPITKACQPTMHESAAYI
jgi:hypothetical protein